MNTTRNMTPLDAPLALIENARKRQHRRDLERLIEFLQAVTILAFLAGLLFIRLMMLSR